MDYTLSLALLVSAFWGVSPVIHKVLLQNFHPASMVVFSAPVYIAAVIIYASFHTDILQNDLKKATIYQFFLIGLTFVLTALIANILYFTVLLHNKSFVISALVYTSPIFTLILASLFLKETVNIYGFIGVCLVVIGICFISNNI
jgi:drug/metabolite transporter (DMT)-like permease